MAMALPLRLAGALFGEFVQLEKVGLIKLSGSPSKFYATTAVDSYGQKKPDWLDNWGTWHEPRRKNLPDWPADFKEFPERDLVNFPHPVRRTWEAKVRLGFIPDSWFQFFYKKTGVTGPYLFGWGLCMFLLQKEIWVVEGEFKHLPPLVILSYLGYKLYGRQIGKYFDDLLSKDEERESADLKNAIKTLSEDIETEKQYQACYPETVKNIAASKRENIGLQLEAVYRERLQATHREVKRRADYLAESEETKRRFEQRHMVNWIVDQVKKSITPQLEQAALKQCISDLKNLGTA